MCLKMSFVKDPVAGEGERANHTLRDPPGTAHVSLY